MPVVSKGEFTVSRLDDGVSSHLHVGWLMADGRFTNVYPGENLLSDTLPNKWPTLENKRAAGSSISKINDAGNILATATGGTPYYFVGNYSATQVLSDDFLNRIRGKRLVASANVTFVNQLTVPTDSLGISIYCWDDTGKFWQPDKRKAIAGSEIISIDVLIPENIVNILVAVRGFRPFVSGASYEIEKMKLEISEADDTTPTIYTPSPSEDYANAYPKYRGEYTDTIEADSTDPNRYTWTAYLGEQGPPTGVISQNTVPSSPYVGMLWQCTGNIAGYINPATYRWNGSSWEIYQFTAQNILAETFTGFVFRGVEFIGSKFVSEFRYSIGDGQYYYADGTTTIDNGGLVTDLIEHYPTDPEEYDESFSRHIELSPENALYMKLKGLRSDISQEMQLSPGGLMLKANELMATLTVENIYSLVNPASYTQIMGKSGTINSATIWYKRFGKLVTASFVIEINADTGWVGLTTPRTGYRPQNLADASTVLGSISYRGQYCFLYTNPNGFRLIPAIGATGSFQGAVSYVTSDPFPYGDS